MTIRTVVSTVDVVEIVRVEAEVLDTPTQFTCDCTKCGWGYFSAPDEARARMEAQAHLDRNHELFDEYDDVEELP